MACKFSCLLNYTRAVKENEVALFYLDVHDVYKIKYKTNEQRELLLLIKWAISKQVLVTVELCSTKSVKCFSSVGSVINGTQMFLKLRDAYGFHTISDYDILCIITIIPHIVPKTVRLMEENDFKVARCVHSDCQTGKSLDQEWDDFENNFTEGQRKSKLLSWKSIPLKENDIPEWPIAKWNRTSVANECFSTNGMEVLPKMISKVVSSASNTELSSNTEAGSPRCNVKMITLPLCGIAPKESPRRSASQGLTDERKVSSSEDVNKIFENHDIVAVHNAMKSNYFVKFLEIADGILQSLQKMAVTIYQKIQMMQWKSTETEEAQKGMALSENLNSAEII